MPRYVTGLVVAMVFAIALMVSAPARMLALVLPAEQVLLQGFEGTVWRGSASRCLLRTGSGYLQLGAVEWSLHPLSLLLFAPRLSLQSVWGSQNISGDVVLRGPQSIDLHEFEGRVAADLLRQFAPVSLGGTFSAQFDSLLIRDGLPTAGGGRLVWQNGGWLSPQGLLPLGHYALDFGRAAGQQLQGQVVTLSGPVEATGSVQLQGREYEIDVLVIGKTALDPQLEQALSLIAAPGPEGYRVELSGEI